MIVPIYDVIFKITRPLAMATDVETAHRQFIEALRLMDNQPLLWGMASGLGALSRPRAPLTVGGVTLQRPLMLSAGMIKGDGFETEEEALAAVAAGKNIIPGWRSLPHLIGAAEFGSYTRWPRVGNSGTVLWRRYETHSTQNRVGLRNPGANAAAAFLERHKNALPKVFGINIAVSPGVDDPEQEKTEAVEAMQAFLSRGVVPSWFTLNLSCPNTEDDPMGNQTESKARDLCRVLVNQLGDVPLWVKVSPNLSKEQYRGLMMAFGDVGVKAVIATNTRGEPTPDGEHMAGVGGGELHDNAIDAVYTLADSNRTARNPVDVIGCGGVLDGKTYHDFIELGAKAVQYYSAMIYRGPLAGAVIYNEAKNIR